MELIVRHGSRQEQVRIERTAEGYRVEVGDQVYDLDATIARGELRSLLHQGQHYEVAVHATGAGKYWVSNQGAGSQVELMDPLTHLALSSSAAAASGAGQVVEAYMPGRVVKILVEEGQEVQAGEGLVVLEAMKMENEIQAESAGTVTKILVEEGQAVEGGDPMIELA